MPLLGTLDVGRVAGSAPVMEGLDTDSEVLAQAEVFQLMYEIRREGTLSLLPPALHPTIPPTVTWIVWKVPASSLGAFRLAQCRIGCRAGVRPRGFLIGAVVDNPDAAAGLSSGWGFRCSEGTVALTRRHDRVDVVVTRDGRSVLDASMLDPVPISGGDVQYVANMNLAHTPQGLRLVQVDSEYAFHRADRGRPVLHRFDAEAWGDAAVEPVYPVSASLTVADVTLPRLRYICDPDVPALEGTQKVG